MDEGRNFPLPATQSRAWENQVKPAPLGRANGGRATFLTIVTADRAAQSRIFARSARECHPNARLVVVVPDVVESPRIFADLYDLVIPPEQLSLGGLADMRFRYSIAELCFALKPWAIRHLFDRFADEPIYYFDSDIEVFTPLAEVEAALAQGANLVLTPHILQPSLDQGRERALLRSGSFNAGFLAVAPSAPARAFVSWWCERVRTGCTLDPLEGTYGDQKWLELAPSICDGVAVLRHPGYNFAYWNAHERPLSLPRRGMERGRLALALRALQPMEPARTGSRAISGRIFCCGTPALCRPLCRISEEGARREPVLQRNRA